MIPDHVRIFVCTAPQDMRRSFDGLALAARQRLGEDPRSGALFCFINRGATRLKVLWFDRSGFCLLYKRAHRVRFVLPDAPAGVPGLRIDARMLRELVAGTSVTSDPGTLRKKQRRTKK